MIRCTCRERDAVTDRHDSDCPIVTGIDPDPQTVRNFAAEEGYGMELIADPAHVAMERALRELLGERIVLHTVAGLQVPGKLLEVVDGLASIVAGNVRYDVPVAYIVTLESAAG